MTMIQSDEEFAAYLAQQQRELAGDQPVAEPLPPKKSVLESWQRVMSIVIPLALLGVLTLFAWQNLAGSSNSSKDPWDKILGTAAWIGGREYNADADTLTERLTFRKPRKKQRQTD